MFQQIYQTSLPIDDKNKENMDFIRNWGYDIQGAIYQAVVEKNTGKNVHRLRRKKAEA